MLLVKSIDSTELDALMIAATAGTEQCGISACKHLPYLLPPADETAGNGWLVGELLVIWLDLLVE